MSINMFGKILIFISIVIFLTGCFPGSGTSTIENTAGFFTGIWHGWIAPISLIVGFFNPEIRVYETLNNGWWYDLGFYIAIIGGFGSITLLRGQQKKKR